MRGKCMGDGHFDLGGQMVEVKGNKATLAGDILAGSVLTMPQAIKNMMEFTNCSLADAISMATYNPARLLKLAEREGISRRGGERCRYGSDGIKHSI